MFRQIWALNSKPKNCRMGLKLVIIIVGLIIEPNIDSFLVFMSPWSCLFVSYQSWFRGPFCKQQQMGCTCFMAPDFACLCIKHISSDIETFGPLIILASMFEILLQTWTLIRLPQLRLWASYNCLGPSPSLTDPHIFSWVWIEKKKNQNFFFSDMLPLLFRQTSR